MALFTGQDVELTCSDCGAKFIFTQGESKFFDEQGFTEPPKRCKPCRLARKAAKQNQAAQQSQQPMMTSWENQGRTGNGYRPAYNDGGYNNDRNNDNRRRSAGGGRGRWNDDDRNGNY